MSRTAKLIICFMVCVTGIFCYQYPTFALSVVGFNTADDGYYTISPDGANMRIDFGTPVITNATDNGASVSQLIGAQVSISDLLIDVNSRTVLTSIGGVDYASYQLTPQTFVQDGFTIKIGNDIVFSADLVLYDIFLFGKTGSVDPGIRINLDNPQISTNDTILFTFLNGFTFGGDLNITIEDINGGDIDTDIQAMNIVNGIVGGSFSNISPPPIIPEPTSMLLILLGICGLRLKRIFHRNVS